MTEKNIIKMLREAFMAGYESPMELMEQEVQRIITEEKKSTKPTAESNSKLKKHNLIKPSMAKQDSPEEMPKSKSDSYIYGSYKPYIPSAPSAPSDFENTLQQSSFLPYPSFTEAQSQPALPNSVEANEDYVQSQLNNALFEQAKVKRQYAYKPISYNDTVYYGGSNVSTTTTLSDVISIE